MALVQRRLKGIHMLGIVLDIVGAAVLALYALLLGPLGVLRGPLAFERLAWYAWVLLPQGLMARSIRTAIDWRLGNFDAAIAQLEGLVGQNEEYCKARPKSRIRRRVLEDLYTTLARAYLHAGHIDNAMLVVIRAKKSLGLDRLGGLAELDAKTAHLVRAGLAAGRLLDGGGLATMFVKTSPQAEARSKKSEKALEAKDDGEPRKGATKGKKGRKGRDEPDADAPSASVGGAEAEGDAVRRPDATGGAKIIPFPTPDQTVH